MPADIRGALPPGELTARCAYAHGLLLGADRQPLEAAAKTRTLASRVLGALPVQDFLTRLAYLDTELQKAAREEDDEECGRLFTAICKLQRLSPQLPDDILSVINPAVAAEVAFANRAASRALGIPGAGR